MEGYGDGVEHVRVDELIRGVWFQRRDDVQADRVFVTLRHLTGWVDPAGLSVTYPKLDDPTSGSYAVVTAVQVPALQTGHGRCSVTLKQTLGLTGDCLHSLGVTQGCLLRLAYPEPQPLSLFLNTARDFQDLLSIAVGEPADVERVIIHHPDVPLLSMAGTRIGNARVDVEYRARWTPRSDPCPPVQRHKMYFTLNDLGGMEGVERWLGVARRTGRAQPRHGDPLQPHDVPRRPDHERVRRIGAPSTEPDGAPAGSTTSSTSTSAWSSPANHSST